MLFKPVAYLKYRDGCHYIVEAEADSKESSFYYCLYPDYSPYPITGSEVGKALTEIGYRAIEYKGALITEEDLKKILQEYDPLAGETII